MSQHIYIGIASPHYEGRTPHSRGYCRCKFMQMNCRRRRRRLSDNDAVVIWRFRVVVASFCSTEETTTTTTRHQPPTTEATTCHDRTPKAFIMLYKRHRQRCCVECVCVCGTLHTLRMYYTTFIVCIQLSYRLAAEQKPRQHQHGEHSDNMNAPTTLTTTFTRVPAGFL